MLAREKVQEFPPKGHGLALGGIVAQESPRSKIHLAVEKPSPIKTEAVPKTIEVIETITQAVPKSGSGDNSTTD
jgi:hypothetical protein